MPFEQPAPDLAKIIAALEEWERGDQTPGRALANMKTAGLALVLAQLARDGWVRRSAPSRPPVDSSGADARRRPEAPSRSRGRPCSRRRTHVPWPAGSTWTLDALVAAVPLDAAPLLPAFPGSRLSAVLLALVDGDDGVEVLLDAAVDGDAQPSRRDQLSRWPGRRRRDRRRGRAPRGARGGRPRPDPCLGWSVNWRTSTRSSAAATSCRSSPRSITDRS